MGVFRTLLLAIMSLMMPLCWACLFLLLICYLFAVVFMQAVRDYMFAAQPEDITVDSLRTFFDSTPMALLTLWMSVSGGISWWDVLKHLLIASPGHGAIFV